MRSPLHIALGGISEGCLRATCRSHGMPGIALGMPDDLSHGPLDDGRARIDYLRDCFRGYDDWYLDVTDALAPCRALIARIDGEKPDAVVYLSYAARRPAPLFGVGVLAILSLGLVVLDRRNK